MFLKKWQWLAVTTLIGVGLLSFMITGLIAGVIGGQQANETTRCDDVGLIDGGNGSTEIKSRLEFAKAHREAFIQGWAKYGFLPSANLVQGIAETSLDPNVPSFGQNHNIGGVKWFDGIKDYDTYKNGWAKNPAEVNSGGSFVGDGTGGSYVWYKDYDAGIIGKAEFLARNPRYAAAVNNTSPKGTFQAIFDGGWATSPSYLLSLNALYTGGGIPVDYLTALDQEAITRYGSKPFKTGGEGALDNLGGGTNPKPSEDNNCSSSLDNSGSNNGAPVLTIPKEYEGKVSPMPDDKTYAGNNYPFGQCTWGAYNRMAQLGNHIEWFSGDGGNGGSWGQTAQARGYEVVKGKPSVGWAASFAGGVAGSVAPYGHIAVVEYVNSDGSFLISETNVVNSGSGTRSWRVISAETGKQLYFIKGRG